MLSVRRVPAIVSMAFVVCACLTSPAIARPGSAPHEAVAITTTTTMPNTSGGFGYAASYHGTAGAGSRPPALRKLVLDLPLGTRIDTSVPAQCNASDSELMTLGEAACPAGSRVGAGEATAMMVLTGQVSTYPTVLFNADHQQIELVEQGGRPVGVARTYINGTRLVGPVPTCITGGDPPSGCPSDQVILLANHLQANAVSVGQGAHRRNYGTTPAVCPRSGHWTSYVTLYYADGSVDRVKTTAPCTRRRPRETQQRTPRRAG